MANPRSCEGDAAGEATLRERNAHFCAGRQGCSHTGHYLVAYLRSLEGSNYLQFTAAISPGNSGGPVIDARGRVVAIAAAKFSGVGVEDLSLGIPVTVACDSVVVCTVSHR